VRGDGRLQCHSRGGLQAAEGVAFPVEWQLIRINRREPFPKREAQAISPVAAPVASLIRIINRSASPN